MCVRDGIDDKTLRKHFRAELDTAVHKANTKVAGTLFQKAIAGDTTAMIWWTKARMRWSERHEVGGNDGGPIEIKPATDELETARWIADLLSTAALKVDAKNGA